MALRFTHNGYSVYTHNTSFNIGVTTDVSLVINGSGSLRCGNPTFSTSYANVVKDATPNHQMQSGFLRARWRYTDAAYTSMDAYLFLIFHQSIADITGASGSFKAVALRLTGTQLQLMICSGAAGLQGTITSHQTTALEAISGGSIYTTAAEFLYDASFGGTQVRAWKNNSSTLPDRTVDPHQLVHVFTGGAPGALSCGEAFRNTKVTGADNIKMIADTIRRQELTAA